MTRQDPATLVDSPFDAKLGLRLDAVSAEEATGWAPVAGNTQPAGLWHGGASAAMIETLASLAACAHAGAGRQVVGTELSVSHLRAVRAGRVHGQAVAQHLGANSAVYLVTLTNDQDALVASGRVSCRILD